jgi:myo-inositol-1(or 4)-monophosphatase
MIADQTVHADNATIVLARSCLTKCGMSGILRIPLTGDRLIMQPLLNIAISAARAAGNIIIRYMNRVDSLTVASKRRNDFVSEVDRLAEQEIMTIIRRAHPNHAILAEESGVHGADEYLWLVDPLDGTTNFLHGFPQYAVSIALKHKHTLQLGVIYDPFKEELFAAYRGAGATLNNRRIRVSRASGMTGALLGTGIPYRPEQQDLDAYLATLKALIQDTAGVRRAGSAALDLAYVACGRLDGYWEFGLKPWDYSAGVTLVQEAGGLVGDMSGGPGFMQTGDVLAASPKVYQAMLRTLRPHLANAECVNRKRAAQ